MLEAIKRRDVSGTTKEDLRSTYKALLLAGVFGVATVVPYIKAEAARIINERCISGSCKNGRGVVKLESDSGDVYISNSFYDRNGRASGCNTHITKNGNPRWNGPYDDGDRDTVDTKARCGVKQGTLYADDHTESAPHYERGQWKDGKRHGNITRVTVFPNKYEVWKNDVYQGYWTGDGHGSGRMITAEDERRYKREEEGREQRRRAAERENRRNDTSSSQSYEWIDYNTGQYQCNGRPMPYQMDFCDKNSNIYNTDWCASEVAKVCGGYGAHLLTTQTAY